jgi:hypothetical protein
MKRTSKWVWNLAVLLLVGNFAIRSLAALQDNAAAKPPRFQDQIDAFLKADLANPPPKGGILSIGSSIFRQWAHL